jgi:hypothetical protein
VVTRDPLTRIRYWASVLREFPIYCEDTFSVDRAKDSVTIRSRFHWRSIEDDWRTPHVKLAPLSPTLGLAARDGGFPMTFSKQWFDLGLSTPFGPYMAVEGVDAFDATFSVLQYVNETEAADMPMTNAHPVVRGAFERLRELAVRRFDGNGGNASGDRLGGSPGFIDAAWEARALPYLGAGTRSNTVERLRTRLLDGLGQAGRSPADTKFGADRGEGLVEALWAYAHFSGDWALIHEHWVKVKKLFDVPEGSSWAGFAGDGATAASGRTAGAIAFARLAYRVGDTETYQYTCSVVARELVTAFVKQRGANYFRQHQPWQSLELMDEEVFLTTLRGDQRGWAIDGPAYPAATNQRQFTGRWRDFRDPDVGRFFRENLKEDVRRELNWLQHRSKSDGGLRNDPAGALSLVPLRSLLLNESLDHLAALTNPGQPDAIHSTAVADCLSLLRAGHPTRFERLIPPGPPGAFGVGIERDVAGPDSQLLVSVAAEKGGANSLSSASVPDWPQLQWREWTTPTGAAWTFGHIRPVRRGEPGKVESIPLNWNTRVLRFELP